MKLKQQFIQSFKNLKTRLFWIVAAMEYGFWATSLVAVYIFSLGLAKVGANMPYADLASFSAMDQQAVALQGAVVNIFIYGLLLVVFIWLNFSFWRGLIWSRILKKRLSFKKYLKFSIFNLPYLIIFFLAMGLWTYIVFLLMRGSMLFLVPAVGIVASNLIMLPVYLVIFLPVYTYLINVTNVFHIKFFTVKRFVDETWRTIKEIRKLCLHLILMGFVLLIFVYIYSMPIFSSESYAGILLSFILIALYCTWLKLYVVKLVHHI